MPVTTACGMSIKVDKDVKLMRDHFHLHHVEYENMSPVIIPRGYTKAFVNGQVRRIICHRAFRRAFRRAP